MSRARLVDDLRLGSGAGRAVVGGSFSLRLPGPANMFCRSIFHIRPTGLIEADGARFRYTIQSGSRLKLMLEQREAVDRGTAAAEQATQTGRAKLRSYSGRHSRV
jgi:hypothetical protein